MWKGLDPLIRARSLCLGGLVTFLVFCGNVLLFRCNFYNYSIRLRLILSISSLSLNAFLRLPYLFF